MPTDVMGSAAWSDFPGDDAKYLAAKCNLLLGRPVLPDSLEPVYGKLHFRRPGHMLSVAPTGSGKGVSLIIPNLLSYMGSMLVIDPKGENAWVTAKWRREGLGNKVYILDPWGEVNKAYGALAGEQETVARFNPLSSLDPKDADYVDDVTYFADALVVTSENAKEPHWDNSAKDLIGGLIAYVVEKENIEPRDKTLKTVRALLNLPDEDLNKICDNALDLGPESVAAQKIGRFKKDTTEVAGVFSTARTQTIFLQSKTLGRNMDISDFSFDELAKGLATVYLVLPAGRLATHGRWLRLMVSMAIRAVARIRAPLDLPVLFMLDEFGTVGRLEVVENAYGLMRGFGIAVWAFLQDLGQLQRDYPKSWRTFIANSTALTCYGAMDQSTAEEISKMLGTGTVEYKTHSETIGTNTSADGTLNTSKSQNTSVNMTGRPLLMPDEVRRLRADLCLVLGRSNPVLCRRLLYYEDYPFYRAARWDPHFGSPEGKRKAAEMKTAAALAQLARQQINSFESGRDALRLCGFDVQRTSWGSITVRRGQRELAKFWGEKKFVPWAQDVAAQGYRRLEFVF
jgi:type IV secretion system protein VirD4